MTGSPAGDVGAAVKTAEAAISAAVRDLLAAANATGLYVADVDVRLLSHSDLGQQQETSAVLQILQGVTVRLVNRAPLVPIPDAVATGDHTPGPIPVCLECGGWHTTERVDDPHNGDYDVVCRACGNDEFAAPETATARLASQVATLTAELDEARKGQSSGDPIQWMQLPATADQAVAMQNTGYHWLAANAPERLTDLARELELVRRQYGVVQEGLARIVPGLRDLLCDPAGQVALSGTEADRAAVQSLLDELTQLPCQSTRTECRVCRNDVLFGCRGSADTPVHVRLIDGFRQYRHNDGSPGFTYGYDSKIVEQVVADMLAQPAVEVTGLPPGMLEARKNGTVLRLHFTPAAPTTATADDIPGLAMYQRLEHYPKRCDVTVGFFSPEAAARFSAWLSERTRAMGATPPIPVPAPLPSTSTEDLEDALRMEQARAAGLQTTVEAVRHAMGRHYLEHDSVFDNVKRLMAFVDADSLVVAGVVKVYNEGGSGERKVVEGLWSRMPAGSRLYAHRQNLDE